MYTKNAQIDGVLQSIERFFQTYLVQKAPALPSKIKNALVLIAPWFTLVSVILIGLSLVATVPSLFAYNATFFVFMQVIFSGIIVGLEIAALPGLFKKKQQGWYYLYYATLVSTIATLFTTNILIGLIVACIGLYVLFQIRGGYR